MQLRNMAGHKI